MRVGSGCGTEELKASRSATLSQACWLFFKSYWQNYQRQEAPMPKFLIQTGSHIWGQVFTFAVLLRFAMTKLDIVFFEGQESLQVAAI
jgi:hypothetical protein